MSLHWRLFKAGTLHSQKSSNGHTAFFNLLSLARSPALKLLAELTCLMDDDESSRLAYFAAMVAMYGSLDNWSQEILDMVQVLVHIACGGLFRRFMVAFQSWPFKLAEVVDRSLSQDERHAVAEDFMDASDCCLDQFFSKPFRDSLTGIQDFFEQGMQDFLHYLFAQSACATTNLENGFPP